MSLTATQLAKARRNINDVDVQATTGANILSDTEINAEYTRAGGNLALFYIFCLRQVWGFYGQMVNQSNDAGTTEQYQQLFKNTKELLDYWTMQYQEYGNSTLGTEDTATETTQGGIEGLGMLDLDLDYYDTPLDDGYYDEIVTQLDAIYNR